MLLGTWGRGTPDYNLLYISEPIKFAGEGDYDINVLKMVTVTDSAHPDYLLQIFIG